MTQLILPCKNCNKIHDGKCKRENLPRFTTRIFECYYPQDVDRFEKLLEEKCAIHIGTNECKYLNKWNQPVGRKYIIVYDYFENIETWVLT